MSVSSGELSSSLGRSVGGRGVRGENYFFSFYKPCSLNFLPCAFIYFIAIKIFILERKNGREKGTVVVRTK